MLGKTNVSGSSIKSLNRACVVWLPLNGDTNNYGSSDLVFTCPDGYCSSIYPGIIYGGCYKNFSNTAGGLVSDKQLYLGNNQSFFCWANFDSFMSNSNLGGSMGGQHRKESNTGLGLTVKYVSSTTAYLSVSTGNGTSRTYNTYCGSTLLHAGSWYHLGYTYDGTTIKLYVNGQLDGTHNVPDLQNPTDYIFTHGWSFNATTGSALHANFFMLGSLNDVRIYNKTLEQKDITTIFEYQPLQRLITKPIRYIRFGMNGNNANTSNHICEFAIYDINNNNLASGITPTVVSGPSWSNLNYITDGATATNPYASSGAGAALLQIDLGEIKNIAYIIQHNYFSDHRQYYYETVSVSADGTNFETLFNSENHSTKDRYKGYSLGHAVIIK